MADAFRDTESHREAQGYEFRLLRSVYHVGAILEHGVHPRTIQLIFKAPVKMKELVLDVSALALQFPHWQEI